MSVTACECVTVYVCLGVGGAPDFAPRPWVYPCPPHSALHTRIAHTSIRLSLHGRQESDDGAAGGRSIFSGSDSTGSCLSGFEDALVS